MVLPVFFNLSAKVQAASCHAVHSNAISSPTEWLLATLVHAVGYLLITALAAWIVYEKLGLGLLRKAWFNLDLVWAVALLLTGGLTLLI
jgi:hypothetical protein